MIFRVSPLWWPFMLLLSPFLIFFISKKNRIYTVNKDKAGEENRKRIQKAEKINLPELDSLEMKVIVEEKHLDGFKGDAGVSYLFKSNLGTLLFDVGFGDDKPSFTHNLKELNFDVNSVDAVAISHLHLDHMGGMKAHKTRVVKIPGMKKCEKKCYVPDKATSESMECLVVDSPAILESGIASTGPLARSLFFFGYTKEQALVANVKNKGLIVVTGCGHPKIEKILEMVRKISDIPVYAVLGGLHFPITDGRGNRKGIKFQTFLGTGKPPWKKINEDDLRKSAEAINMANPKIILLSAHDSCDDSLELLSKKLNADTRILKAGKNYSF